MKEENKVACNYEEMYKQKDAENRYLNMQLEEQRKCYEDRINNLENDLSKYEKYEKENKWLKDIINSILHIYEEKNEFRSWNVY